MRSTSKGPDLSCAHPELEMLWVNSATELESFASSRTKGELEPVAIGCRMQNAKPIRNATCTYGEREEKIDIIGSRRMPPILLPTLQKVTLDSLPFFVIAQAQQN